jgi:hypothetical protein
MHRPDNTSQYVCTGSEVRGFFIADDAASDCSREEIEHQQRVSPIQTCEMLDLAGSGMMAHGSVCLLRLAKISSGPIVPWTGRQVLASLKKIAISAAQFRGAIR